MKLTAKGRGDAPSLRLAIRAVRRLFRHDRLIAWNTARATFASWNDRIIAVFVLLGIPALLRSGFADRPWKVAAWASLAAGAMFGMGVQRVLAGRLSFHSFDGVLAADALHPRPRLNYMAQWHGIGLALLVFMTLIARPTLLVVSVPAILQVR